MDRRCFTIAMLLGASLLAGRAFAQTPREADVLIEQLADDGQRRAARAKLIALGAAAVPAMAEKLATMAAGPAKANTTVRDQLFAILTAIGPDAGAAMPQLVALLGKESAGHMTLVDTLAELVPWRDADVDLDLAAVHHHVMQRAPRGQRDDPDEVYVWQRLQLRCNFPRQPDLDLLLAAVQGRHALRIELAVEHLGRRGPAAAAALPALQRLLERPEPRVLISDGTVPMHRKAAVAVLAIAPAGELAVRARDVLAGKAAAPLAVARELPPRVKARIDELLVDLAAAERRETAAANLLALGELSVVRVAALLSATEDPATIDAALAVLRDLGPRAGAAVPRLLEAVTTLPTAHTVAVLRTLVATSPGAVDVVPFPASSGGVGSMAILGRKLRGTVDEAYLTELYRASATLRCRLMVDPAASLGELEAQLEDGSVQVREFALEALAARGGSARRVLPALGAMLQHKHPLQYDTQWVKGGVTNRQVDRTAIVHRLAARAIVAIAPADDSLAREARNVLATPEEK